MTGEDIDRWVAILERSVLTREHDGRIPAILHRTVRDIFDDGRAHERAAWQTTVGVDDGSTPQDVGRLVDDLYRLKTAVESYLDAVDRYHEEHVGRGGVTRVVDALDAVRAAIVALPEDL